MKRINIAFVLLIFGFAALAKAEVSLDTERLNLEMRMQQRVEEALGKILSPGQFVVVIRIDPIAPPQKANSEPISDGYFLPGVPTRVNIDGSSEQIGRLVDTLKSDNNLFQRFIRRIRVILVLDDALPEESVNRVRELTRQMISFDAERGDTLDIQRTTLGHDRDQTMAPLGVQRIQRELKSYWVLISLALIVFCIAVFILFMFGPLRDFLNKFVAVIPTLKQENEGNRATRGSIFEQPAFPFMPQSYSLPMQSSANSSFSGSLQVENPNKTTMPFGFIREDHLGNLAILLARETPEKAAVVLGYLPPDWISRVLSKLDPALQSEVAANLATTRQLLPEQVEDIEQDLKRRLDYLIGGPERLIAVYESLEPQAQKRMLASLKATQPELAEELRNRTMLFEDLGRLEPNALRALLREVDLQTIILALRGVEDSFKERVMDHMTQGKAQIVKDELEISEGPAGRATVEAQRKIVLIAKRLEREGQINIPQVQSSVPAARYGGPISPSISSDLSSEELEAPLDEEGSVTDFREKMRKIINQDRDSSGPGN